MDKTSRTMIVRRPLETHLGCRVERAHTFQRTAAGSFHRVDDITLSHPAPLHEVAFSALRLRRRTLRNPGRS